MRVLPVAIIAAAVSATAQIPNAGFESWTGQGGYTEPVGWLTYNDVPTVGGPTVEAGTPGHPGSFFAAITTRQSTGGAFAIQGWTSAGATPDHGGFPCPGRPAALTGQWQYDIQPNDTAQALVAFSRWDGAATVPLGIGTLEVTGSINDWQPFTVPITWLGSETPDTAYIQIVSSIDFGAAVAGSTVRVDDFAFSGTAGLTDPSGSPLPAVQFAGAGDQLLVTASVPGTLQFFDAGGRLLAAYPVRGVSTTLNIAELPQGMLLYRFIGDAGKQVRAGKWERQ